MSAIADDWPFSATHWVAGQKKSFPENNPNWSFPKKLEQQQFTACLHIT